MERRSLVVSGSGRQSLLENTVGCFVVLRVVQILFLTRLDHGSRRRERVKETAEMKDWARALSCWLRLRLLSSEPQSQFIDVKTGSPRVSYWPGGHTLQLGHKPSLIWLGFCQKESFKLFSQIPVLPLSVPATGPLLHFCLRHWLLPRLLAGPMEPHLEWPLGIADSQEEASSTFDGQSLNSDRVQPAWPKL